MIDKYLRFFSWCALAALILLGLWMGSADAKEGEWEWEICGVRLSALEDRNWGAVVLGGLARYAVHEAGHYIAGKSRGMDVSFYFDPGLVVQGAHAQSEADMLWFGRGGWMAELTLGGILTAIPQVRGSDFMFGYSGTGALASAGYAISGRPISSNALGDVKLIDEYGGNGRLEAGLTTVGHGFLLYLNRRR